MPLPFVRVMTRPDPICVMAPRTITPCVMAGLGPATHDFLSPNMQMPRIDPAAPTRAPTP
jgi:hypothetical protein